MSNCSNSESTNSDLSITGLSPSPYPSTISIGFIWSLLLADTSITSPPSALTSAEYSPSGSQIIISSSVDKAKNTISSFALKLLPLPGTPSKNDD